MKRQGSGGCIARLVLFLAVAAGCSDPSGRVEPERIVDRRQALVTPRFPSAEVVLGMPAIPSDLDVHPYPVDVELSDLDGDGDQDIVAALNLDIWSCYVASFLNRGDGTFVHVWNERVPGFKSLNAAVADIDRDGRPDILARNDAGVRLFRGDGAGSFAPFPTSYYPISSDTGLVTLRDLDRDGYPDMLVVEGDYENALLHVFRNNRDGTFGVNSPSFGLVANQELTPPAGANPVRLEAADVNADGFSDLIVNAYGHENVLIYPGSGSFVFSSPPLVVPAGARPIAAHPADVDNDGDADLITVNYDVGTLGVLMNLGGTFAAPRFFSSGYNPIDLSIVDLNGDCYLDALVTSTDNSYVSVSMNAGDGSFVPHLNYSVGQRVFGTAVADVDGDRDLDVVAANKINYPGFYEPDDGSFISVVRNLGDGRFWAPRAYDAVPDAEALATGDFNDDGHDDFAFGSGVLLSSPDGRREMLVAPEGFLSGCGILCGVEAPDLNGDGLDDLIQNVESGVIFAYTSNGDGTFNRTWSKQTTFNSMELDTGRLNRDDLVDFVNIESWAFNNVFLGATNTTFNDPSGLAWDVSGYTIGPPMLADLNRDGLDEIVVTNWEATAGGVMVARNLGDGTRFEQTKYAVPGGAFGTDAADYDGDDRVDVAVAVCGTSSGFVGVLRGNGDGTLEAVELHPAGRCPRWLASGDFDRDGDIDIVASNRGVPVHELNYLVNSGNGTFEERAELINAANPGQVVARDFDDDGDLDLAVANSGAYTVTIFDNHVPAEDPARSNARVCDRCPADPGKLEPGACGCGVPDTDADSDGTPDCRDACPRDANKIVAGACGCGAADADRDGDGTADCNDECPLDAAKIVAGACGCGVSDADSDSDTTPDCNDACPADAAKIQPGICGCGTGDSDSDADGTPDCQDACPSDPDKRAPGGCGCGVSDADDDGDGTPSCRDECPDDAAKVAPGICGCGVGDIDQNRDGTLDCRGTCDDGGCDGSGLGDGSVDGGASGGASGMGGTDGGASGGASGMDGGASEAGSGEVGPPPAERADSGSDAGFDARDPTVPGNRGVPESEGGCACALERRSGETGAILGCAAAFLLLIRRSSRRHDCLRAR